MSNLTIATGANGIGKSTFGNYLDKRNDVPLINNEEYDF
jgi:predicted ABC-type ATPase